MSTYYTHQDFGDMDLEDAAPTEQATECSRCGKFEGHAPDCPYAAAYLAAIDRMSPTEQGTPLEQDEAELVAAEGIAEKLRSFRDAAIAYGRGQIPLQEVPALYAVAMDLAALAPLQESEPREVVWIGGWPALLDGVPIDATITPRLGSNTTYEIRLASPRPAPVGLREQIEQERVEGGGPSAMAWNGAIDRVLRLLALTSPTAAQPEQRWRSMDDAPKDGSAVLLWKEGEAYTARWLHSEVMGPVWATPDGHVIFRATHWMPLPAQPEQEER